MLSAACVLVRGCRSLQSFRAGGGLTDAVWRRILGPCVQSPGYLHIYCPTTPATTTTGRDTRSPTHPGQRPPSPGSTLVTGHHLLLLLLLLCECCCCGAVASLAWYRLQGRASMARGHPAHGLHCAGPGHDSPQPPTAQQHNSSSFRYTATGHVILADFFIFTQHKNI